LLERSTFEVGNGSEKTLLEMAQKKVLKHGLLIAIEGIDGAGKTTQSRLLSENLSNAGYPTVLLHEPTNGVWGEKIRDLARNGRHKTTAQEELELFYQDRLEDVEKNIGPKMRERNVVIMDRYYFSSVAYQGARGLDPNKVEKVNEEIAPHPNVTIILDISPSDSLKRIRATREEGPNHFERAKYLRKVRSIFLKQFANRSNVAIIDGDGSHSEREISDCLWALVEPIVHEAEEV
jgi:dTMP kinase